MKAKLTSFFVFFALAGSVLAGMSVPGEKIEMKDCCDRARSKDLSRAASMARICCALKCGESAPTSSGQSFNYSSPFVVVVDSMSPQITDLVKIERFRQLVLPSYLLPLIRRSFQPKYIQYHSFLI